MTDVLSGEALGRAAARPSSADHFDEAARATGGKLPRRGFFSEMPDKGLFALFSMSGFMAVLLLKVYDFAAEPVAALAVGLMAVYGILSYRVPKVRLRLDRLGDNFYYMGFVFTLASMSAALLQLRGGVRIEPILGSFGVALLTTIVGIAGRVVFVQMRSEVDDVEQHIRTDLLNAGTELKGQLGAAIHEFEMFRIATNQVLHERLGQTIELYTQRAQALNATTLKMSEEAERLAGRLAAIDPPSDRLNRALTEAAERLEASAAALSVATAADMERRKALVQFGAQLNEVSRALVEQAAMLKVKSESLNAAGAGAEKLAAGLGKLDAALTAETTRLKEASAAAGAARESMEADLAASRAAMIDTQRAFAETARAVAVHLAAGEPKTEEKGEDNGDPSQR